MQCEEKNGLPNGHDYKWKSGGFEEDQHGLRTGLDHVDQHFGHQTFEATRRVETSIGSGFEQEANQFECSARRKKEQQQCLT
jgi:hypothetical protein